MHYKVAPLITSTAENHHVHGFLASLWKYLPGYTTIDRFSNGYLLLNMKSLDIASQWWKLLEALGKNGGISHTYAMQWGAARIFMTWMADIIRPINICRCCCLSSLLAGVCRERAGHPVTDCTTFHHKVAEKANSKYGTKWAISERLWESLWGGAGKALSDEAKGLDTREKTCSFGLKWGWGWEEKNTQKRRGKRSYYCKHTIPDILGPSLRKWRSFSAAAAAFKGYSQVQDKHNTKSVHLKSRCTFLAIYLLW